LDGLEFKSRGGLQKEGGSETLPAWSIRPPLCQRQQDRKVTGRRDEQKPAGTARHVKTAAKWTDEVDAVTGGKGSRGVVVRDDHIEACWFVFGRAQRNREKRGSQIRT
jgi:hypothetical protein